MSSEVFICNLALGNIAKPAINSIDGSEPEAIACKLFYRHTLRVLLQSYPWLGARSTKALAGVTNTKPDRWLYDYAKPADHLKTLMVTDSAQAEYMPDDDGIVSGGFAYAIEGAVIFCDVPEAYLIYTFDLEDTTQLSPLFEEAFGWHLAVRLAMPLTRDPKLRADAYQLAVKTTDLASAMDANEVRATTDTPSGAIEARK